MSNSIPPTERYPPVSIRRIALTSPAGDHLRYVHSAVANALVDAGHATERASVGRTRAVALTRPATSYAERIGPASAMPSFGVRFTRWARFDSSATRIIEHHPRCLY